MTAHQSANHFAPAHYKQPARLGVTLRAEGAEFALYSTTAHRCQVRTFERGRAAARTHEMARAGDGFFVARVPGIGRGALYRFVLDGRELPDPYARFLPEGVHGPGMVVESAYSWKHGPGMARPLRELSIYEIHIGTFTPAGTYQGASERLAYLADLGVTAIELMPLAAFAGSRGWGYDGVAPFAPFAPYGTPDELRALVDEAHGLGLAVLLDVVYNHFGPSGNYLSAYSPQYFTRETTNAWGDSIDYAHPVVRQLVLESARYWLTEFRFDGLRLDATHAICDRSPRHILRELADEVRALRPAKLLIAEDERNEPALVEQLGFDAVWADDFHHGVHVTLTGEREGYYGGYQPGADTVAKAILGGWLYQGQHYPPTGKPRGRPADRLPAEAFVYCLQNHDQIGNRARGERLSALVGEDALAAVSALLLFLPMTPLIFMGEEWAASSPFLFFTDHDPELGRLIAEGRRAEFKAFEAFRHPLTRQAIPDPQQEETFLRSRLRWQELKLERHRRLHQLYRWFLRARRSDPVLSSAGRGGLQAEASKGDLVVVRRWNDRGERLLLCNLGSEDAALDPRAAGPIMRGFLTADTEPSSLFVTWKVEPGLGTLPGHSAMLLGRSPGP
jgi:maltooligosyltrehalose trehalohydrolase